LGSKTTQFWASKRHSFGHFTIIFFKRKNIKNIKKFIYFFRIILEKKRGGGKEIGGGLATGVAPAGDDPSAAHPAPCPSPYRRSQ
jgi:hypothetical protein